MKAWLLHAGLVEIVLLFVGYEGLHVDGHSDLVVTKRSRVC